MWAASLAGTLICPIVPLGNQAVPFLVSLAADNSCLLGFQTALIILKYLKSTSSCLASVCRASGERAALGNGRKLETLVWKIITRYWRKPEFRIQPSFRGKQQTAKDSYSNFHECVISLSKITLISTQDSQIKTPVLTILAHLFT